MSLPRLGRRSWLLLALLFGIGLLNYLDRQTLSILKATPYLAVLAVPEMLGRAFDIASQTYRYTEPLVVAGLIFLALALVISHGVKRLERRLLAVDAR